MKKIESVYIEDMREAIAAIERFTSGVSFEQFAGDEMRYQAVIRMLEVLGEAANHLSADFRSNHPTLPINKVIAMRNFLIHGYDEVDITVVWETLCNDIPLLKQSLEVIE